MASRRSERRQFKAFFNLYLDVAEACSPIVDLSDPDTLMAIWKHANPPQDQIRRSSPRIKAFLDSLERNSAAKKNLKREFKALKRQLTEINMMVKEKVAQMSVLVNMIISDPIKLKDREERTGH